MRGTLIQPVAGRAARSWRAHVARRSHGERPVGPRVAGMVALAGWALGGCGMLDLGRCHERIAGSGVEPVALEGQRMLATFRAGEGRRVILVHGTPGDASAWTDYLARPIDGAEMVAVDRPGFGCTTPREAVASIEDQAAALEPLLEGGRKPILVGHSLGGAIVARAAIEYPDRVGGIVIVSGSLDPALERVMWIQHVGNTALVSWMIPRGWRNANREVLPLRGELEALGKRLGEVRCPVAIVHGARDRLVGVENVDYTIERLTGAPRIEVVVLDGEDHFVPWTAEGRLREVIAGMMAEVAGRG